jgi:molybdenum cofactor sulfurtransferase
MRIGNMERTHNEHEAERSFIAAWPAYETTAELDVLHATEYSRLDRLGQVYLDYTGAGLCASSQLCQHLVPI